MRIFSRAVTALSWPQVHPVAERLLGFFQDALAFSIIAGLKFPISVVLRTTVSLRRDG